MAPKRQMSHSHASQLIKQRELCQANMARTAEWVKSHTGNIIIPELECRLEILQTYFHEALANQTAIEEMDYDPEVPNAGSVRAHIEELYCQTKSQLQQMIAAAVQTSPKTTSVVQYSHSENLPKLKLPTFTGKYAEYPNFKHLFTTLIHNESRLTPVEKFNHLRSCLSGVALRAVEAFDVTSENYEKSLLLLDSRFNNKYLMCEEHIQSLFTLQKISKESAPQLRLLVDTITSRFNALESLTSFEELSNALIVHLALASLDNESRKRVEEAIDYTKPFSWSQCAAILNKRCQVLEARGASVELDPRKGVDKKQHAISLAVTSKQCHLCKQPEHQLWKCPSFLELSPIQRFEVAKSAQLCINCLTSNHSVRQCKSSTCKQCKSRHHTLLHRANTTAAIRQHPTTSIGQQQQTYNQQQHLQPQFESNQHITTPPDSEFIPATASGRYCHVSKYDPTQLVNHTILATVLVKIGDKIGNTYTARALLDSASQLNFMTHSLSQKLNLDKFKSTTVVGGIGESQCKSNYSSNATISSRHSEYSTSLQFSILPTITGHQPSCKVNTDNWHMPANLPYADPDFATPQQVDLLLGADIFFEVLHGNQMSLGNNCPTLFHTKFGWIVSGKYAAPNQAKCSFITHQVNASNTIELENLVKHFWEFEKVPESTKHLSKEQHACETHFQQHVKRLPSGRFMVKLPLKLEADSLGDSQNMAKRRFLMLEKRLDADTNLKVAYTNFLREYETDDHMQKINWPSSLKGHYILPHHCVLRPEKSTTKCRVVFDASARTTNNLSLNDIMMIGPVVQGELFEILLRFRLHQFGMMADITAMYRQILVYPEDQRLQNIIWRENREDEMQLYCLKTVTYGTAAAPFLATRCLLKLAEDNMQTNPSAAEVIKHDFYVDDLISGGESLDELQKIKRDVSAILGQAKFKLHKWHSNHDQFLSEIPDSEREKTINVQNTSMVKALGVMWDSTQDAFKFSMQPTPEKVVTKRSVLSDLSKLFDPLGFVKPIIVKAKIFLQELWLKRFQWDEQLPEALAESWKKYVEELMNLNKLQIHRYVLLPNSSTQLHGFADASARAYGCCLYVRAEDAEGNVKVSLYAARSKVAPLSVVRSLPCLELSAAQLLVQLLEKVRNLHNFNEIILWSDSVIVLGWISEHASSFNTFVANRVSYIQEKTSDLSWNYVQSANNPADIISRGCTVAELTSSIWLTGPNFLQKSKEFWPKHPKRRSGEQLPEKKQQKSILIATSEQTLLNNIYATSNFYKLCIRFAYIRRFILNCRDNYQRTKRQSLAITAAEFDKAVLNIVVIVQKHHYGAEIELLKRGRRVSPNNQLKMLNPFVEEQSGFFILKVGGRLKHAPLPYEVKYPIILPKNDMFVYAYFRYMHTKKLHIGAQALLSSVRETFWVIGGRDYARKTVQRCLHCFKYKPKLLSQLMGDLPRDRVTPVKPFTYSGIDFCGPILTTTRIRGRPKFKSYIAVFVCFVTKAVHLEVVSDLTSEAFIAALKRFVGRRGLCKTLYCDNATNFVGARNLLRELSDAFLNQSTQQQLIKWCTSNNIQFQHIPPRSPHYGGIWEAAVKSAKSLLYKAMQSAVLTFEELTTVMVQIEGILNSRPLTALSTDPSDEQALTPAHFLNLCNAECMIEPNVSFTNISRLTHWKQISALQQHFWQRWTKEYVTGLQQRRKWDSTIPNLQVGVLVLVHEDNLPPQKWLMGRVTQVFPGSDGKVRVAEIETSAGFIKRSIVKLAALPVDNN